MGGHTHPSKKKRLSVTRKVNQLNPTPEAALHFISIEWHGIIGFHPIFQNQDYYAHCRRRRPRGVISKFPFLSLSPLSLYPMERGFFKKPPMKKKIRIEEKILWGETPPLPASLSLSLSKTRPRPPRPPRPQKKNNNGNLRQNSL